MFHIFRFTNTDANTCYFQSHLHLKMVNLMKL